MSTPEEIKQRIRKLEEIPTLPTFFNKIMETLESERASVKDLAVTISQDPALTAKVFKLANSAYYGRFKKVSTVEQAVSTIGFNEIKTVSLSIAVFGSFSSKITTKTLQDFWMHALTVATAIQQVGARNQESSLDKVYFGGLLHDIGKLVFTMLFGDDYFAAIKEANADLPPLALEKKVYGVNHAQVGKWLCERWHFPSELGELIANHHQPTRRSLLRPKSVATVYVADYISHNMDQVLSTGADVAFDTGNDPTIAHCLNVLQVSTEELASMFGKVGEQQERIKETFSLIC